MQAGMPVIVSGKISARDDKEPQIVADMLRPISDITAPGTRNPEYPNNSTSAPNEAVQKNGAVPGKRLFVKLQSEDCFQYERLKLVLTMFPGREQMVIHFDDTKKNIGTKCIIHDALVRELHEMLGAENVVVR